MSRLIEKIEADSATLREAIFNSSKNSEQLLSEENKSNMHDDYM